MASPLWPHRYHFISRKNKYLKHHYWLFHLRPVGLGSYLPQAAGGTGRLPFPSHFWKLSDILLQRRSALHDCRCWAVHVCGVGECSRGVCPHINLVMLAHRECLFVRDCLCIYLPLSLSFCRSNVHQLVLPCFWTVFCLFFHSQLWEDPLRDRIMIHRGMRRGERVWLWSEVRKKA